MEYLYEKVSYIKGLAEGLSIEEESKEGKLLMHIIDALEDIIEEVDVMKEDHEELSEYVEYIDEDLTDLEDDIYGDCECDEEECACYDYDEEEELEKK